MPERSERTQAGPPTFTVGDLNRLIRYALSVTFPDEVWVEGEIASLRRHEASGHVYFQLVDSADGAHEADATLHVALYRANRDVVNARLRRANPAGAVKMADGVQIRIRGVLDYYPPQGRLQLRMTSIDPAHTLGRLAAERDRVLAMLGSEGLLGRNSALAFPVLPLRVGLITSAGSAAHADFLHELDASGIGWQVTLADSRVQGPGADHSVVAALGRLERHGVDVIALVRGGGARSDLMTFDSEVLARAIAGLRVAVVTGIGHETDSSVADAIAARSFKTPTACAAALVERARTAIDHTERTWTTISARARIVLDRRQHDLLAVGRRLAFDTHARLSVSSAHTDADADRLARAAPNALTDADRRVTTLAARLDAVDPQRALARGWSITRTAAGVVVRRAEQVQPGDTLISTLESGTVRSIVAADHTGDTR